MTARPQTFVEHDILQADAERGIHYSTFLEFWEARMEPMQFIARGAEGVFAVLRQTLKDRAEEQYQLFTRNMLPHYPLPTGADSGNSPPAGQGGHVPPHPGGVSF